MNYSGQIHTQEITIYEQEKTFCNIFVTSQPFDLPYSFIFSQKQKNYLVKYDQRTLYFFILNKDNSLNFLRKFIFYNFIENVKFFQVKEQELIFIFFEGNYLTVYQFDNDLFCLTPVSYFNFNIPNQDQLKVSTFQTDHDFQFNCQEQIFFSVKDQNQITIFGLKTKEFQWLFPKRKIPQNELIKINQNVYSFKEKFFIQTAVINLKTLISDKIQCVQIEGNKREFYIYALVKKLVSNTVHNNSLVLDQNSMFIKFVLNQKVIENYFRETHKRIKFEHVLNQTNFLIIEKLKNFITKFYLIKNSIENTFIFEGKGFLLFINNQQYGILIFQSQIYEILIQQFQQSKLIFFPSQNFGYSNFKFQQKENLIFVQYNEFFCAFKVENNVLNMYYFNTFIDVLDIDISEQILVYKVNKKQNVKNFNLGTKNSLKENEVCIQNMIQIELQENNQQNLNSKIQNVWITKEETFIVDQFQIMKVNHQPFSLKESIQSIKTFQNSWNLGEFEEQVQVLLLDYNNNFFLLNTRDKKLIKHSPGFQLSEYYHYQGFYVQPEEVYVLVSNCEAFFIDRKKLQLKQKQRLKNDAKITIHQNKIIQIDGEKSLMFYYYQDNTVQVERIEVFSEESEKIILNIVSDNEQIWIYEKNAIYYVFNDLFEVQFTLDIKNFHECIIPNQSFSQNESFSITDPSVKLKVSDEYSWPKIIENQIFEFDGNKYLFLLLDNKIIKLYKIINQSLLKLSLNNPAIGQMENLYYLKVLKTDKFVLLQVNEKYVNMMYKHNGREKFKQISSQQFQNCFYDSQQIYTLSANQINVFKCHEVIENVYTNKNKIHFAVFIEKNQNQDKNYFLICQQNSQNIYQLILINEENQKILELSMEPNEEITLLKQLHQYSKEKYQILIGYNAWNNNDFFSKWKILHLDQFKLNQKEIRKTFYLQQSSQEKCQRLVDIFELEGILFICLENFILQIEQYKITASYQINLSQISKTSQKNCFFIVADVIDRLHFYYFSQQRKELVIKGGCNVNGKIESVKFLKGNSQRFLVLTENGDLNGFLFLEREIFNQVTVILEQFFKINFSTIDFIVVPQSQNFSCLILDKNYQLYYLYQYSNQDIQLLSKLKKHMEDSLPFLGGFSSTHWLSNEFKNKNLNLQVLFIDFYLLQQYLNQNSYLQKQFEEEIGYDQEKILNKIQITLAQKDNL